jgi:hypothetical protein
VFLFTCVWSGLSPIGNADEMLGSLMEKLRTQLPSGGAGAAGGAAAPAPTADKTSAVLAQRILDLAEQNDWEVRLRGQEQVGWVGVREWQE